MNLNLHHMRYFFMTVKLGGVTRAARELGVSQPALSSQLKLLETQLDRELFDRAARKLTLTEDGHRVFGHCRLIFEAVAELEAFLTANECAPRIRIGVSEDIERPFVVEMLGRLFHEEEASLSMVTTGRDLERGLIDGEIDLLLTDAPPTTLEAMVLAVVDMPVMAVGAAPLVSGLGSTAITGAEHLRLVLPSERMRLRHEIDYFLRKVGCRSSVGFESDMMAAVVRALGAGFGYGFMPFPYVEREIRLGSLVVIGPPRGLWLHRVHLLVRRGVSVSRAATTLAVELKRHSESGVYLDCVREGDRRSRRQGHLLCRSGEEILASHSYVRLHC